MGDSLVNVFVGVDYVGTSMMRGLLAQVAVKGSAMGVGSLESVYGAGQVLGSLTLPYFSDSWGRRAVLQLSCLGTAIGYGLAAAVVPWQPSLFLLLLCSRAITGLVKQTLTMARAIVGDTTQRQGGQAGMALLTMAASLGYMLGPIIGNYLADVHGVQAPMWLVSLLFLALLLLCGRLPETAPALREGRADEAAEGGWDWLQDLQVWLALLSVAFGELALTGWTSVARPRVTKRLLPGGYSSTTRFDTWLSVCVLLASELLRRRPLLSARNAMVAGNLAFAAGLALLLLWPSWQGLYACSLPLGVGISAARTLPAALLNDMAPDSRRGAAMGSLDIVGAVCRVLAPLLTGAAIDRVEGMAAGDGAMGDGAGLLLLLLSLVLSCFILGFARPRREAVE